MRCGLEISVTRVTAPHHAACPVMPNSPEWRNFQFAPNNQYGYFFFLHSFPSTIAFKLAHVLFYQFYARLTVSFIKKCSVRLLSKTLTSKRLTENNVKIEVMHESRLTPPHVRWYFLAPVGFTETRKHGNPVGYTRIYDLSPQNHMKIKHHHHHRRTTALELSVENWPDVSTCFRTNLYPGFRCCFE